MKIVILSALLIILQLSLKAQQPPSGQSQAENDPSTFASYITSFFDIKSVLEKIETTFKSVASKEKKDNIILQMEFMRSDMVRLLNVKRELFTCAYHFKQCEDYQKQLTKMTDSFQGIRARIMEINQLCSNKYEAATGDIERKLTTDLNLKERNINKILKDAAGVKKVDEATILAQQQKTEALAIKCIQDIDILINKMKKM